MEIWANTDQWDLGEIWCGLFGMGAVRRDSFLSLLLQQYCEVWSGGGHLAPWKEGPEPLKEVGQALTSVSWTTSATTCSPDGTTWNYLLQTTSERKIRVFKAALGRAFAYLWSKASLYSLALIFSLPGFPLSVSGTIIFPAPPTYNNPHLSLLSIHSWHYHQD